LAGVVGLVIGVAAVAGSRRLGSRGPRVLIGIAVVLLAVAAVATAFGSDVTGFQFVERRPLATQAALLAGPLVLIATVEFARLERRPRRTGGTGLT